MTAPRKAPRWRRFDWKANRADIEAMLAAGATGADVARRYGLKLSTAFAGIKRHGMSIDPAATHAARAASCHRMNADPEIKRLRSLQMSRMMRRPEVMEASRERMRRLHTDPGFTARVVAAAFTPEVNARRSAAHKRKWEAAMAWCPPHLRDEYRRLIRIKRLRMAEAKLALAKDIRAFEQTFEGQLWKLRTGRARLVENVAPPPIRPGDTFEITGRRAI